MGNGDYARIIRQLREIGIWTKVQPKLQNVLYFDDLVFKPKGFKVAQHLATLAHKAFTDTLFTEDLKRNCWYLLVLEADYYGYQPVPDFCGALDFADKIALQTWLEENLTPKH